MSLEQECKGVVLFVDDSKTARAAAVKALQEDYTVVEAHNGEAAWEIIKENKDLEIIFADIHMPVSNGLELLKKVRKSDDSRIANLPLVIITGIENSEAAMRVALNMGATDFISKPFRAIDLLSRTYSYITLSKKIKMLEADAIKDKDTGFYLNNQFETYARKSLSFAKRYENSCSFVYLEIDTLSDIYLQHSKNVLTQILEVLGKKLAGAIREEDLIAQLSTNCFGLVLPATGLVKSQVVVQRLLSTINKLVFNIDDESYQLDARIALCTNANANYSYKDITRELDAALSKARRNKKKIVICGKANLIDHNNVVNDVIEVKDSALTDSLIHVLNGDYHKILETHVKDLSEKLNPFISYAQSKNLIEDTGSIE